MHIQKVILDGFKSYADRTDIGNFDRHFNAITGLNGSGKSNILDGIIFVLGLSSLGTVRAQSLGDLIHKGNSGVTKASVSLVFNNHDRRPGQCPPGYEGHKEIIVTRTIESSLICKYYLNGQVATKKAIQDMFESVHLNINNPNFMIMQGKITKVVNMKPKELLHMIEETVGALSYQNKRDKSCKEIEERDRQLKTTNRMMDEVVRPAISRQLNAARLIDEYKLLRVSLDKFSEEYAYASYKSHYKNLEAHTVRLRELEAVDKGDETKVKELKALIHEKTKEEEVIKKESNARAKEKLAKLEKIKGAERKKKAGLEAQYESANANLEDAKGKLITSEKAYADEVKQMEDYKKKSSTLIGEFTAIKEEIEKAEVELKTAKDQETELKSGKILGDDGKAINLREKIDEVDNEIGKIRPNHDHEVKILENEKKSLKQKETELGKTPSDAQVEKDYKTAEAEVGRLKRTLNQKQLKVDEFPVLEKRVGELKKDLHRVQQKLRNLTANYPQLALSYKDPYPNFNRKSVHGFLFELFEIKEPENHRFALESAFRGNLTRVIVDDPKTCADIITHGDLARRTSFMPISKMGNTRPITQAEVDKALGKNRGWPALSCVTFEEKYRKVIEYFFGRWVICVDHPAGKVVAYQMNMGLRAVTLSGDIISDDGTMQGGFRKDNGQYITRCQDIRKVKLEERELSAELQKLETKLEQYNKDAQLLTEYQKAERILQNAAELRKCTAYAALSADIAQLKEQIQTRSAQIKAWGEELADWNKERKSLTEKLNNFEANKAKGMKVTEALIQKWTKALESAKKKYDSRQATFKDIELELNAKEAIITNCSQEIEQAKKEVAEMEDECKKKQAALDIVSEEFKAKDADYEEAVKEAQELDDKVAALAAEVENLQQQIQSTELSKMTRDNDRKEAKDGIKSLKAALEGLKEKYKSLDFSEPDNFPPPTKKMSFLKAEIDRKEKALEEKRLRLDYASAGKAEESQAELTTALERLAQVTKNRLHIQEAIDILDVQKLHLVRKAFARINDEFGAMMTTLLPESQAKLVPVKSLDDLDAGVNIHVRLGGIWKESLSELSGGQRSLVALALVLALCLFCPAPFYVLDEVDAALDLSHTQNIGVIIQQRFKDTQFICVSLKDGMYSNANVLFQTSFANGKSAVSRSVSVKK